MDIQLGNDIKGYELRERIGAGGFGAVYRAYQSTVGREVAIKFILPGFSNQPDFIRRFETEAQLVARLEHPHITPLYDYWRDPDGAYLVMRWLRGGSLREALQNNPFDLRSAALLLDQIGGALWLAHRAGVIHRDLKPGNILLDEDGNAYLADFGIAKDLKVQGSNTQPDAVVGSLDYISPEQARSEPVTPRTDIYSLGVVLYEMLAGHHPFQNMSAIERLYKHISDPLPELTGLDESVEDAVNKVIQKATAKNPDHRYADALAMAADFREAAGLNRTVTGQTVEALLTPREHEISNLIIEGRSNKEIAQHLTVTLGTVKWYVNQIYSKLRVRSRVQAIIRARELNLIGGAANNAAGQPVSSVSNLPEPENPYKGLRAFQSADEQDFFGRDDLTHKLLKRLGEVGVSTSQSTSENNNARFLAVIGPSGSGKSSLVKAGLIPAVWRGDLPGSEKWFVVEMLPGAHPLDKLEVALMKVAANQSGSLNEQLARDKRGLLRASDLILPDDGSELLLVIDQFEEVFTLVEDETERQHFLLLLMTAVQEPRSRVRVIVTLRADFYDRPLRYPEFGELVRSQMETVMPLSAKGLERAIAGPAERVGIKFESGLVAAMVAEMNYQAGALPLLQYALTELFERREGRLLTHKAYQEIGGAGGALAKRAEELYLDLSPEGQEAARQMFMRLVTLGEGVEDTRRRTARSELLAIAIETDVIDDLIDTYANYRLLSLDNDPATRTPTVELAHEAILREWERLRSWLNDSREDIRLERQLMTLAAEWEAARQDASFLMRGARLEIFEKWLSGTKLSLTPGERTYLQTSLTQREKDQVAEVERQAHAKALEQRSMKLLRLLVGVFALAAVIATGLSLIALRLNNQSTRSAAEFRSIALSSGAAQALDDGQPDVALALAQEAVNMDNPPSQSQLMFFQAATSTWIQKRYVSEGERVVVWDAAFSPDGQRMITTSFGGRAILWDVATGEQLQSIHYDTRLMTMVAFHPNGRLAAIGSVTGVLLLWNLDTNAVTPIEGIGDFFVLAPVFNRDGTRLLASRQDGTIYIWDVASLELVRSFKAHEGKVRGIHFNADETRLVTAGEDGQVRIWDVETGDLLQTLKHPQVLSEKPWVYDAHFLPDGNRVLSGDTNYQLYLWDWRTGEILWHAENNYDVQDIALSPDGTLFATASSSPANEVRLWEVETGALIRVYRGHTNLVESVEFSPDGTTILSASEDGTAILWSVLWEGALSSYNIPSGATMAVHPSLPLVAVADESRDLADTTIRLVDTQTGAVIRTFDAHDRLVAGLAFSPDGRLLLASQDYDDVTPESDVYIWDVESGKQQGILKGHIGALYAIAFSPDSRRVATGSYGDMRIIVWDVATHKPIQTLESQHSFITALHFSPDGRTLYSGSYLGYVSQWDVQTGEVIRTFAQQPDSIWDIDVTGDGTRLVAAVYDGIARVWDTTTNKLLFALEGHRAGLRTARFSPDQRTIITASEDSTLILWDATTGERLRRYVGNQIVDLGPMADFSTDGRTIISAGNDWITVWDAAPLVGGLVAWTRTERYIPDLTCDQRALYQLEPLCVESTTSS